LCNTIELDKLQTVARMLDIERVGDLYLFHRTGFSERLHEISSEHPDVHLIATTDMS
jgi:hypothetical protein